MTKLLLRLFVKNGENPDDPKVRSAVGTLSGVVGIACNLLLFGFKLLVGTLTGSVSITADAMNNLSDATSSIVTMLGFRLAGKKPDSDHPFGHGRMEYISGLVVAGLILLMGAELVKSSVDKIAHPEAVTFSWLAAAILLVSIAVKLYMYMYNKAVGKKIDSAAMAATAAELSDGHMVRNVVLFSVLVYELVGPTLTKLSLTAAGEIRPEGRTSARVENQPEAPVELS